MHEDQYAVALWVRPCNSVPISSIAAKCPAVWRELRLDLLGLWGMQTTVRIHKLLLFGRVNNKASSAVFGVFLTFAVLWQDLMRLSESCFTEISTKRAIFSKLYLQLILQKGILLLCSLKAYLSLCFVVCPSFHVQHQHFWWLHHQKCYGSGFAAIAVNVNLKKNELSVCVLWTS